MQRSKIVKRTVPVRRRLEVSTTAHDRGPFPDGKGGSESV